jgi:hypothetical protein
VVFLSDSRDRGNLNLRLPRREFAGFGSTGPLALAATPDMSPVSSRPSGASVRSLPACVCSSSRSMRPFAIVLSSMLFCCGCGQSDFDVAPATVKVVCSGKPVTTGTVMLRPIAEGAEPGKPAIGRLQEDGTFVLSTYSEEDGAIVGKHRVFYSPPEGSSNEEGGIEGEKGAPEAAGASAEQIKQQQLAMKNACVLNEEKIVEVTADGPNEFTIDLVPASRAEQ